MAFPPPCHALLQGFVPTQGMNLDLLLCRHVTLWATREALGHHNTQIFLPPLLSCYKQLSVQQSESPSYLRNQASPAWNHQGDSLTHKWNANSIQWDSQLHGLQPLIVHLTSTYISALSGIPDSQACYCLIFAPVSSLCASFPRSWCGLAFWRDLEVSPWEKLCSSLK